MSSWMVAVLAAAGGGVWVYSKFMHSTGSDTKNSLIGAATAGALIFLLVLVVMNLIFG